jgi:hypothetical protein
MMGSYVWAKVFIEILDDPKMGRLSDRLWRRTIELVLMAKEIDAGGSLPALDDMAWRLRTTPEVLETELIELVKVSILDNRADGWYVINYNKRQGAMTDAERMTHYRERKRKAEYYEDDTQPLPASYDDVTNRNTEEDKEKIKSKKKKRANGTGPLPDIPESLATPDFLNIWAEYVAHRKEKRSKMTPRAAKMQLKKLEAMGPDRATAAICHSIANGWLGIFEDDKARQNGQHAEPAREKIVPNEDGTY